MVKDFIAAVKQYCLIILWLAALLPPDFQPAPRVLAQNFVPREDLGGPEKPPA